MPRFHNPNFDKKKYWRNRNAGLRGQMSDKMYEFIVGIRERIAERQLKLRGKQSDAKKK